MSIRNLVSALLFISAIFLSISLSFSPESTYAVGMGFGVLLVISGLYSIIRYQTGATAIFGVGSSTNGLFLALGNYLNLYATGIDILVSIFGLIASIVLMLVYHAYVKGKADVDVRLKKINPQNQSSRKENSNLLRKIEILDAVVKKQKTLDSRYKGLIRWQLAYVIYQEELAVKEEKNAVDFVVGRKVELQKIEMEKKY